MFGRAWNNGGVLECSFPYNKQELKGKSQLGGDIQVLCNQGDYSTNGYWFLPLSTPLVSNHRRRYDWVKFPERRQDHLVVVYCGQAAPIYTKSAKGETLVGNMSLPNEIASVSYEGRADDFMGRAVNDMLIPVRNFKFPPSPLSPSQGWVLGTRWPGRRRRHLRPRQRRRDWAS